MKIIIWSIIIGILLSSVLRRGYIFDENLAKRNKVNKCAHCNNDFENEKRYKWKKYLICDKCDEYIRYKNSKEYLIKSKKWYIFVLLCGIALYVVAINPFYYIGKDVGLNMASHLGTMFALLVCLPCYKVIEVYMKLKKIQSNQTFLVPR